VNSLFSLLGSANHNERSMWHDSEAMLAVAGYTPQDFPGKLQKELMHTVLSGHLPKGDSGVRVYRHFLEHLKKNVEAYSKGQTQPSLVFPYLPKAAVGIGPIS
jgi:phosphatidylserine/phosphatidylglycerophosphate/cardiolipin synthase-like enzyme